MSIQGQSKTEATYRAKMLDSSSSLKDFSFDRKKYFRKYIMNEEVEDKDTAASVMGRIVECLLLEPELFDKRFYMSACVSAPTGLGLKFVEALYERTREATDNNGEVTKSFEEISKLAYVDAGYKLPYEGIVNKFVGSNDEIYYNEIRVVRSNHMDVVTPKDITNAENIVESLKTSFVTSEIVNLVNSTRYSVMNQFQVEGYSVEGHLFKSMMDKMIADHQEKLLWIYDLKCVWAVEDFYREYYLFRRAYIQGYLYWKAAISLTLDPKSEYYGYTVMPPKFIVCDSINYFSPLIYEMSHDDLKDAFLGFEYKKTVYPGVKEIINNLKWALDNSIWNISKNNYLSGGILNIKGNDYDGKENSH